MLPNLDPRQMKRMMQQMGIKSEEINADRVVIEKSDGKIIISNPQIMVIDMQGQRSFQIVGTISEEESVSEDDINLVTEQTKVSKAAAKQALQECNGDIAQAILKLQKK